MVAECTINIVKKWRLITVNELNDMLLFVLLRLYHISGVSERRCREGGAFDCVVAFPVEPFPDSRGRPDDQGLLHDHQVPGVHGLAEGGRCLMPLLPWCH